MYLSLYIYSLLSIIRFEELIISLRYDEEQLHR